MRYDSDLILVKICKCSLLDHLHSDQNNHLKLILDQSPRMINKQSAYLQLLTLSTCVQQAEAKKSSKER